MFLVVESRAQTPLVPLRILHVRTVAAANLAALIAGFVLLSSFFLLTLYTQQLLEYSPLETGVAFLIITGPTVITSAIAQALTTRFGPRAVMSTGFLLWGAAVLRPQPRARRVRCRAAAGLPRDRNRAAVHARSHLDRRACGHQSR
jgi:hypothetical protein